MDDTEVRFSMTAWLHKREMSRVARYSERKDGEEGQMARATSTEKEQVDNMVAQTASAGVEAVHKAGGDGRHMVGK